MSKYEDNAPKSILVEFEYEFKSKNPYYALSMPDCNIDRVELESIHSFFGILDDDELDDYHVGYWEPTQHGYDLSWRLSARQFMDRVKLKVI